MSRGPVVSVLGSMNVDISVTVPRLPEPGETVLGASAETRPGGKGANQAVATARLGAITRMNGCRGGDEFGRVLDAALTAEGVDISGVRTVAGTASGVALITVDAAGENMISVAPGANSYVDEREVAAALSVSCDVLVLSAEIPPDAVAAGLTAAGAAGVISVLNLAPVPPGAADLLRLNPDWLVVNAPEAGALLGWEVAGADDARRAAALLAGTGARQAVVTLGRAGAVLDGAGGAGAVAGFGVRAVDSVGAGDAFVGALAVAVAAGLAPEAAVHAACAAGAAAVTRRGAQAGLPGPAEILAATGFAWPVTT